MPEVTLATLEVRLTVVDPGSSIPRLGGGYIASQGTRDKLYSAVGDLQDSIREAGLTLVNTGHGVTATRVDV
jgi:hypothetical protein